MQNPGMLTKLMACVAVAWQYLKEKWRSIANGFIWTVIIVASGYVLSLIVYLAERALGVA